MCNKVHLITEEPEFRMHHLVTALINAFHALHLYGYFLGVPQYDLD